MRFWWRELSGWFLIGLAMLGFVLVYEFRVSHYLTEAWVIAIMSLVVFLGGVQLLKVAIAARICQQAQEQLYPEANGRRKPAGR
jgi:predicted branched-subunit amino acid permease